MTLSRKRSKLYVDKGVQGMLIRQLLIHWCIVSLVMFLFLLIMQVFSSPTQLSLGGHLSALWAKYGVLCVALLTVFPVFVYDSIKLSNRFAGPMVSFRISLENLAQGKPIESLNFRKRDFWHDISGDLNAIARRMNLLRDNEEATS